MSMTRKGTKEYASHAAMRPPRWNHKQNKQINSNSRVHSFNGYIYIYIYTYG